MSLSDEDRAALHGVRQKWLKEWGDNVIPLEDQIAEHFLRLGAERMRERAAKECEQTAQIYDRMGLSPNEIAANNCVAEIRALKVE